MQLSGDLLHELEAVVRRLGWELRYERGDFHSGVVRWRRNRLVVLNRDASLIERGRALRSALLVSSLDEIYLTPALRRWLNQEAAKEPLPRGRPGERDEF
jgi:hypothetical protein